MLKTRRVFRVRYSLMFCVLCSLTSEFRVLQVWSKCLDINIPVMNVLPLTAQLFSRNCSGKTDIRVLRTQNPGLFLNQEFLGSVLSLHFVHPGKSFVALPSLPGGFSDICVKSSHDFLHPLPSQFTTHKVSQHFAQIQHESLAIC